MVIRSADTVSEQLSGRCRRRSVHSDDVVFGRNSFRRGRRLSWAEATPSRAAGMAERSDFGGPEKTPEGFGKHHRPLISREGAAM